MHKLAMVYVEFAHPVLQNDKHTHTHPPTHTHTFSLYLFSDRLCSVCLVPCTKLNHRVYQLEDRVTQTASSQGQLKVCSTGLLASPLTAHSAHAPLVVLTM